MYGKSANLNNSNSASTADNSNDKIKSIKYTGNSSSLTWKDKLHSFIQTKFFKIYSCIITVISLLLDDIQIISSNESADLPFDIIHIVLSLLIFIEIIIFFIADETYGFSLFFFIDIIFLVSLLFGIMKIYDKLIYYESGSRLLTNMDRIALIKLVTALKVLRIIRIGKIVTMFNHSFFTKSYDDDNETEDLKEEGGNISSTFIDFSSYKIFVFYASLVIGVILFNPELFMTNKIYDNEYSIQLFSEQNFLKNNIYSALLLFDSYIDFLKNSKNVLIFAKFYDIIFINDTFNQKLRKSERLIYYKEYADYINNTIEDKDNTNELDKSLIDYIKSEYFNDSDIDANQLNNIIKEITFDANNTNFLLFTETNNKNILIINSSNYGIYQEKLDRLRSLNLIPQETSIQSI